MNKQVYYRLIALWVFCEAMLGGIIHGFHLPVSGLVVGSCAVVCISLIAWYVPTKGSIIKATIVVAIFKMMLSPQSPPPAYVAVFFQGLLGELLFWNRNFFRLSCILLAVLSLLESGLQRILMLTIVYGNDLWKVVNNFMNGLTKQKVTTNYSLWIGSIYVALHFITGIVIGWLTGRLPAQVNKWSNVATYRIVIDEENPDLPVISKKKQRFKKGLFIMWLLLIALYVQSYYKIGTPLLPAHISLKILLRSFIIILSWIFIVGPAIKKLLHWWLQKKKTASQQEIKEVLQLLPTTQNLVIQSWKRSADKKRLKKIGYAAKLILINALNPNPHQAVYILTGPIQTGKTTSLINWSEKKDNVYGILTPIVNGKRMFMDVNLRHLFLMEAKEDDKEVVTVGRYVFNKANFDKAIEIIRTAINHQGWLVIDEIGPMELRGDGFNDILKEVLTNRKGRILLVVREGLVEKVTTQYDLHEVVIINEPPV